MGTGAWHFPSSEPGVLLRIIQAGLSLGHLYPYTAVFQRTQSPPPTSAPSAKRHDLATWYNNSTSSLSPTSVLSLCINVHNSQPPMKYRRCGHRAVAVFRHAGILLGSNVHLNCLLTPFVAQKGKGETFAVNCSHLLSVNSKTPWALQNYYQVYPTSWSYNTKNFKSKKINF